MNESGFFGVLGERIKIMRLWSKRISMESKKLRIG